MIALRGGSGASQRASARHQVVSWRRSGGYASLARPRYRPGTRTERAARHRQGRTGASAADEVPRAESWRPGAAAVTPAVTAWS